MPLRVLPGDQQRSVNRGRFGPPKARFGRRDVPLTPTLATALWNERKARKLADDAPVFASERGDWLGREVAYRAVKAAAKRAVVPWAGLRTLRHTCALILFRQGCNAKQVQVWARPSLRCLHACDLCPLLPDDLPEPPQVLDALLSADPLARRAAVAEALDSVQPGS